MLRKLGRPLIVLFLSATLSSAQGTPAPPAALAVSWTEVVARAAENNEELQAAKRKLNASEYELKSTYSNYYPQISASLSATQGSAEEYAVSLNATQNLFAGFGDSAKVEQKRANLDLVRTNLQSAKAKISYDLKAAVADLVYAENNLKLSENILKRRELNLRMVQLRFDGGRENKGSLLLSKAYLEDARWDQLQALQGLQVAQSRLAKVLGEAEVRSYSFTGKVPTTPPPAGERLDFHQLVIVSPEYKNALAQESLQKANVTAAEAGFYPSLSFSASSSRFGDSWYPGQNRWSLGAALSFPLFNGGRDYYQTRGALESLKAGTLTKGNVHKEQLVKLQSLYSAYVQAEQKLKVDQAYVAAAEAREKISRQKYNNGLSTFDEWDLIESELIRRQKSFLASEKDRVLAEASWEQGQGKGVLE